MIRKWVVSFFGAGLLPMMPGTFGSLAAAVLFLVACALGLPVRILAVPLILICAGLCVWLSPWAEEHFKRTDPRQMVLDEVVGQWLTLLFAPLATHQLQHVAIGFLLFRAFDVAKPFPIRELEKLPRGWGILLDDVAAGIYAGIALWALTRFIEPNLLPAVTR